MSSCSKLLRDWNIYTNHKHKVPTVRWKQQIVEPLGLDLATFQGKESYSNLRNYFIILNVSCNFTILHRASLFQVARVLFDRNRLGACNFVLWSINQFGLVDCKSGHDKYRLAKRVIKNYLLLGSINFKDKSFFCGVVITCNIQIENSLLSFRQFI